MNIKRNLIIFCIILLNILASISQNIEIESFDCNTIKSNHFLQISEGANYAIQLEKEIFKDLWVLTQKATTASHTHIFSVPENGNYRVSIVETKQIEDNVKITTKISNQIKIACNDISKSILEEDEVLFKIFPNPALNAFFINCNKEINSHDAISYEVIDLLGNIILKNIVINNNQKVDISRIPIGTYFCVFREGSKLLGMNKLIISKN